MVGASVQRPTITLDTGATPLGDPNGACGRCAAGTRLGLGQQLPVLPPGGHGMNHHLLPTFKDQYNGLKQSSLGVEAEP
jgi:hypothetical protein